MRDVHAVESMTNEAYIHIYINIVKRYIHIVFFFLVLRVICAECWFIISRPVSLMMVYSAPLKCITSPRAIVTAVKVCVLLFT